MNSSIRESTTAVPERAKALSRAQGSAVEHKGTDCQWRVVNERIKILFHLSGSHSRRPLGAPPVRPLLSCVLSRWVGHGCPAGQVNLGC